MRRLRSASSSSVARYLNGRIEVSPAATAVVAAPISEESPIAPAGAEGAGGFGAIVSAPAGGVVEACAGAAGRSAPTAPRTVVARKCRRPISGWNPFIVFSCLMRAFDAYAMQHAALLTPVRHRQATKGRVRFAM